MKKNTIIEQEKDEITQAINDWLLQYSKITEVAEMIHAEELPNSVDTLALQRSGVEKLPLKYISEKGWYRQYQYILLLKSYSEDDLQRLKNLDWLDKLSNWIDEQGQLRNFPKIKDIKVKEVSCANAMTYETNEEGSESLYYLQLFFNLRGGY